MMYLAAASSALLVGTTRSPVARASAPSTHCTIYPCFSLLDYDKAKPFMDECIEVTKTEAGSCTTGGR